MKIPPAEPPPDEDRTHWARVRALVEGALAFPAEEREAFLEDPEHDPALVPEARELLAQEGLEALEPPRAGELGDLVGAGAPADDAEEDAPPRLGPYRLLRRIGAGGMGTVHLAVRDDGQFAKRVALKLVKRGMDTEQVLRRFEQERQVLASLDHPGIARVLDGGRCPDGRPYLVMELVEGVPIDRWCDHQGSSVRERIELFAQVCDAVDDAHRSLVVHRDIKPSNVLVTTDGRPKLLDFGIAKVLDARQGFATIDLTATPLKLLTPAYASPEQVRGEPVTTASDVYSLGVVLYQLLTGRTPLRFETGSPAEIERVVCTREPERPSAAIAPGPRTGDPTGQPGDPPTGDATRQLAARRGSTPKALRRALAGDLDTVVLKALRKEPRRRYASAAELAADLRRHLSGLPVLARPDTLAYRASRFVGRNRAAVAAATLVLLSLVVGLAVSMAQYARAEQARVALAAQLAVDQERGRELELLADDLERQRGRADTARAEAEARLEEVRGLNLELDQQRALALERLADVRNFATELVFDVHRSLVPVEHAEKAREQVVTLGLGLLDGLAQQRHGDPLLLRALVGAYLRLAEIQADEPSGGPERLQEALATTARALEIGEELMADDPQAGGNRFALGSALFMQGEILKLVGRRKEADESCQRALAVTGPGADGAREHPGVVVVRAAARRHRGAYLVTCGELDLAEELFEHGAREIEALLGRFPNLRESLASIHIERSRLAAARRDANGAVSDLERALELLEALLAEEPNHALWRSTLRGVRIELVTLLSRVGREEDAARLADGAQRELEQRSIRERPSIHLLREGLALGLVQVARAVRAELWPEAHAKARVAVARARELRELDPAALQVRLDLGLALLRQAEAAFRLELFEDASSAALEAERHFRATREVDPDLPHARQGRAVAQSLLARICERQAADAEGTGAPRAHLERARAAWQAAQDALEGHPPIDPWGAPDPAFAERIAEGLARSGSELAGPASGGTAGQR